MSSQIVALLLVSSHRISSHLIINNIDNNHNNHHHRRCFLKFPAALPTKALQRGKAPLSHESQPFRHSSSPPSRSALGGKGGEAPVGLISRTWRRRWELMTHPHHVISIVALSCHLHHLYLHVISIISMSSPCHLHRRNHHHGRATLQTSLGIRRTTLLNQCVSSGLIAREYL